MKALILKDTYVIWRQMKYFLVMILLFSALPSGFNNAFAIVYASMLPYTALAYDERSKWDQMAAMMPYSSQDIVLGKYAFGWLCIAAAAVLSALFQAVLSLVTDREVLPGMLALSLLGGFCILAVSLPVMFHFGVEKGRLAMFLIIFLVCGTAGAIANIADSATGGTVFAFQGPVLAVMLIAALVLTAVSVPLSLRFYKKRQF
ncbi:ABC-2 transporter permease [Dysosmobacter sp.]|uniref:ABC-2 transporter permease n=1 Tax=Dysosmobacter sp. TaxID=2591382 RepID=UPI002A906BE5|nr:ABC-2 transporter permease [Dysosmobacter sp.]MDY3984757.1 ABC-2 transporter permease [Dysosmobacter sp.]